MATKTIWSTVHIRVPNEMVYIGKNGKITIKPPLTKKGAISNLNKTPAIKLIQADVSAPEIIASGDKQNIDEIKVRQKKLKVIKNNLDKLPAKKRGLSKADFLERVRSKLKGKAVIKEKEIIENEQMGSNDINITPIKKKKKRTTKIKERRENRQMGNNDIDAF